MAPAGWSWSDSRWLEVRAFGWMLGVTLPATVLIGLVWTGTSSGWDVGTVYGSWWGAIGGTLMWVVMVDVVAFLPTIGAALVALPFTMLLGRAMRPVRSRVLHVAATSALAGVLAALPLVAFPDWLVVLGPVSVAAGAAGALARNGEFRRADRLAAAAQTGPATAVVPTP
ncbi:MULTISPECIES: hypothetical protein [unclassified Curtobacterium]|uniref:hypothetical protein n=1 Tax=unclassified Curtobacterium TaxID=257496 RepID=UPI00382D5DB9